MIPTFTAGQIFSLLFLTLGPMKVFGPFAKMTRGADASLAQSIAVRGTIIASLAIVAAAVIGVSFLAKFSIPIAALTLAAGVILFVVAFRGVLAQYEGPDSAPAQGPPPTPKMAMSPLAFPTLVTPYGTALVILFAALAPDMRGKLIVMAIALGIMLLNLIAMFLARRILAALGVFLQILGAVLTVIQVALGLNAIVASLRVLWQ